MAASAVYQARLKELERENARLKKLPSDRLTAITILAVNEFEYDQDRNEFKPDP